MKFKVMLNFLLLQMYSGRRGTDKNHPGQSLPDERPSEKTLGQKPREQLRENLYRGLLSGFFVPDLLKIWGSEMCDVLLVVRGCVTMCDRGGIKIGQK